MIKYLLILLLLTNSVFLSLSLDSCGHNEFLCNNGQCIDKHYVCDGTQECNDGSDETTDLCKFRSCSESLDLDKREDLDVLSVTNSRDFRCNYGACISPHWVCNAIHNCLDGSDETEELCKDIKCKRNELKCSYGGCLHKNRFCNNVYNCPDCSDESSEACKKRKKICRSHQFTCDTGSCIRKKEKCNGVIDCLDGSDESEATCGPRPGISITMKRQHHSCRMASMNLSSTVSPTTTEATPEVTFKPTEPVSTPPAPKPLVTKASSAFLSFPSHTESNIFSYKPIVSEHKPITKLLDDPEERTPDTKLEVTHCPASVSDDTLVELFHCGGMSCDQFTETMPIGSILAASCKGEEFVTLNCQEDGLWHLFSDVKKVRKFICDSTTSTAEKETPVYNSEVTSPPTDCGKEPLDSHLWLVGLFRNGVYSCTGTIIGPHLVLTAGHCIVKSQSSSTIMDVKDLTIQHPLTNSGFVQASQIILYSGYQAGITPQQDLALVKLEISLPKSMSACIGESEKLAAVSAMAFNRTEGDEAYKWVVFPQMFDSSCYNKVSKCSQHVNIGSNQFCATNQDSSLFLHRGSSGGPYMINTGKSVSEPRWTIAGIVSNSISSSECEKSHSVFEVVAKYRSWIIDCGFGNTC